MKKTQAHIFTFLKLPADLPKIFCLCETLWNWVAFGSPKGQTRHLEFSKNRRLHHECLHDGWIMRHQRGQTAKNKRSWTKSSAYIVYAETWRKFGKTNTLHRRYVINSCSLITIDKKRNCFEGKTQTCMFFCQRRWRQSTFTTPRPQLMSLPWGLED